MVTITSTEKRKNAKEEDFNVLILQGDVEPVISKNSGRPYLTAKKTSIPCTFDDATAKKYVGKTLPGAIERVPCEEYEYQIPGSKEKVKLFHTYEYNPEPSGMEEVVMG